MILMFIVKKMVLFISSQCHKLHNRMEYEKEKNKTTMNMVRCMLKEKNFQKSFGEM
jgi:hypothetical protein